MQLLYETSDLVEATLLNIELENAGIDVLLFNQYAQGAVGELPVNLNGPQIWLKIETQRNQAEKIVQQFTSRQTNSSTIFCAQCHEQNPANFTICWKCNQEL